MLAEFWIGEFTEIKNSPAKEKKQTNKNIPNQFLDLFFFVTCPIPMNHCASLADLGGSGREEESLFQLVLPAGKAVSATPVGVCGFGSWSEPVCRKSAADRGVVLLT